ncbi:MAG: hypothetical protein IJ583_16355 [Firmicutes bacterium]|nr:hypothetical protein [Bacillota bacterium]
MKSKYMKPAVMLCLAFSCLLGAVNFASADDMKLTLTVEDTPNEYTMTIPANTDISSFGYTALADGLKVSGTVSKKAYVEVSVNSQNDFKLVEKDDNTKSIAYSVQKSETEKVDKFTFDKDDFDTAKEIGVYVTQDDWNAAPAGEYSDVLTFTAQTKDKEAGQ